ncbi:DUF6600 domain-containing protein [Azohydromonas caseinilytica]|uniref:FecR family protein n=1 Tax=Azohydromonas caseinilytica TaxID=2728836 RepID=A0A848F6X4_9BURK|nr:DUF6600 domain-containing protein [Azohydromonas caseinilytica]NML14476.1 hypothetical protein [Azohydromonas caseinilytica]
MRFLDFQRGLRLLLAAAVLLAGGAAWADPPGRVGRLAQATGTVWIYDQEQAEWTAVSVNRPVTGGDRLATDRGARADVQIGSASLRLDGATELVVDRLDDERVSLRLEQGGAALRLRTAESVDDFELLAGDARFQLMRTGHYRVDVRDNVTTAQVWSGEMRFQATDSALTLQPGTRYSFWRQDDRTHYDMATTSGEDDFGMWVLAQDRQQDQALSTRYVSPEMTGALDLDRNGRWDQHPEYGAVWFPTVVIANWAPYRYGHWAWVSPWGWSWVDDAPWGFAPFHYGRWTSWRGRWCWVPGRYVARPVYAPALVGWIGGSHFNVGVVAGRRPPPPLIGWVPLAPRDPFVPRFNATPRYIRNVNAGHAPWQPPPGAPPAWTNRNIPGAVTVVPTDTLQRRVRVADRLVPRVEPRWNVALPTQQPVLPRPDRPERPERPDPPNPHGHGPAGPGGLVPPPPSGGRPSLPQTIPPGTGAAMPQPGGARPLPDQPGRGRPPQPGAVTPQPGGLTPPGPDPTPDQPGRGRPPQPPGVVTPPPGGLPPGAVTLPGGARPPQPGTVAPTPDGRPRPPGSAGPEPGVGRPPQPGTVTTLPGGAVPPPPGVVTTRPGAVGAVPPPPGTVTTRPGAVAPQPPGRGGIEPGGLNPPPRMPDRPAPGAVRPVPDGQGGTGHDRPPSQRTPGGLPGGDNARPAMPTIPGERIPPAPPLQRGPGDRAGDSVPGAPPRTGRDQIPPAQRVPGGAQGWDNARPAMPTIPGDRVPPSPPLQRAPGYQAGDAPGAPPRIDRDQIPPAQRVPGGPPVGDHARPAMPTISGDRVPPEPPRVRQQAPVVPPAVAAPPPVQPRPSIQPVQPVMPPAIQAPMQPRAPVHVAPPPAMPPGGAGPVVGGRPGPGAGGEGRPGGGPGGGEGGGGGRFGGGPRERQ